ncbi:MAG: biotin/lipoyl-binding protein, partial [Gammaproteobacteria bacterium]
MTEPLEKLPSLREELELFKAPPAFDGSPSWTLYDPANQCFYRLNRVETEILSCWHLGSAKLILQQLLNHHFDKANADDVVEFIKFLTEHNLLLQHGQQVLQQRLRQAQASRVHWLKKLLYQYLFFKIPLFRPERFLSHTYPAIKWLYHPFVLYFLIIALFINIYLLIDRWSLFSQTFLHLFSTKGLIYFSIALIFSKILHELAHAFTAQRYGCKVPTMGVAFLVMWPVLYTDTTEAWKLSSKSQRLAIGAAGMIVEIAIAILCTSLWHFLPDGAVRSSVFSIATATWVLTLLINLNPFMRFDGYFLLSDYLGVANLQQRAFSLARWRLRELLFAFSKPIPEVFPAKIHKVLIIYSWSTWIYRFFLFLSIAMLVYFFFFKLLGLFLMLVEITWFIILPFIKELHYWIKQREQMRFNKNTLTTLSIILLLIVVIFIPWQSRIETPALLTVKEHTILFMPLAAKLNKIRVKEGQSVEKGQVLIQFSSTDLQSQIQQQKIKISALHRQISFHGQETHLNKNRQVLLSELANAESEYKSLEDEKKKLTITAPLSGSVLNINESLKQEQWFAKDEPLLMLAQFNKYQIEAYISEEYLEQIKSSNKAWFYPDNIEIQT